MALIIHFQFRTAHSANSDSIGLYYRLILEDIFFNSHSSHIGALMLAIKSATLVYLKYACRPQLKMNRDRARLSIEGVGVGGGRG